MTMSVLAGTSGFSYAPWKGSFYPHKLPNKQMLAFYASQLPAVEINNTFYRMPKPTDLAAWAEQTPENFCFALKAPRRITHTQKLQDCAGEVARLAEVTASLAGKRGPILFQLPPFLRLELGRLTDFLATLTQAAPDLQAAFEFRHASWFCDPVYEALSAHKAALCIADAEGLTTPMVATASWGYLRLRQESYPPADLERWFDQVRQQQWSRAFAFFKHEDAGVGPKFARALLALAAPAATPM